MRCDPEPAITALSSLIKRHCTTAIIEEATPKEDKNANGHAERAVQALEGQTRSVKLELESDDLYRWSSSRRQEEVTPQQHQVLPLQPPGVPKKHL